MTRTYGVAVLGLGHWYSAFGLARALPEYPRARLVAVSDPDADKRDHFARVFGLEAYADPAVVLARPDVDIVHIAAPVSEIPALVIAAAQAGKHIIMGKPMAMTLAQADAMVAAVESSGVTCVPFQGLMRLRHAGVKARVEAGEIGDVAVMHQTARWAVAEDWYQSGQPGWFVDPAQVPGGALIDEGIYWMDFFRWMAGSEPVEVFARTRNIVHTELAVEDWGFALFTFANGVTATLEGSWTITAPRRTAPAPKQNSVVRLEVVGTQGELMEQYFRTPGTAVLRAGADDWVYECHSQPLMAPASPFPLTHLVACLDAGTAPVATIRDARASLAMALAAYASAKLGQPVPIDS